MSDSVPCAPSPASQSGKFQRKLDATLGMKKEDDDFYTMETPLLSREDHERVQEAMLVNPLHESVAREVAESPDLLESWSRKIESEPWVVAYEHHPLVQSASREERTKILRVALHMDATQFAKRNSLLVFTTLMLTSGTKHLALAIRKSSMWDCGCGGWCTLFPLYRFVLWSLVSLASSNNPASRHDGSPWITSDDQRKRLSGTDMAFKPSSRISKGTGPSLLRSEVSDVVFQAPSMIRGAT